MIQRNSLSVDIYIYIYIYICVCVCVCVVSHHGLKYQWRCYFTGPNMKRCHFIQIQDEPMLLRYENLLRSATFCLVTRKEREREREREREGIGWKNYWWYLETERVSFSADERKAPTSLSSPRPCFTSKGAARLLTRKWIWNFPTQIHRVTPTNCDSVSATLTPTNWIILVLYYFIHLIILLTNVIRTRVIKNFPL